MCRARACAALKTLRRGAGVTPFPAFEDVRRLSFVSHLELLLRDISDVLVKAFWNGTATLFHLPAIINVEAPHAVCTVP